MKTTNFAAVDGAPIDRVARRVAGEGEHWKPLAKRAMSDCSDVPIETQPLPRTDMTDLSGEKIGRLKVVGYWGFRVGSCGSKERIWVTRCDCGYYTKRRQKFLQSSHARDIAKCNHCMYFDDIKNGRVEDKCPPSRRDASHV